MAIRTPASLLLCSECGAEMRVITVIQDKPVINKILESIGEATDLPEFRINKSIIEISVNEARNGQAIHASESY